MSEKQLMLHEQHGIFEICPTGACRCFLEPVRRLQLGTYDALVSH
jgi:hypothetical protein